MKLPMPIRLDGKVYTDAKLQTPAASAVANARREGERGDPYMAIAEWCAGCVEFLDGPDGETRDVKRAMKAAPWKTAVAIALYGRAEMADDDGISSVVKCPDCGERQRLEKGEEADLRDRLYALDVGYLDGDGPVSVEMKEPVSLTLKSRGVEEEVLVSSVAVGFPTLTDCSRAWAASQRDEGRAQLYTLAEALVAVNGRDLSPAEKATFGKVVFERMKMPDIGAISDAINGYGIKSEVERYCQACGFSWKEDVNVMGFFASALR